MKLKATQESCPLPSSFLNTPADAWESRVGPGQYPLSRHFPTFYSIF